MLSRTVLALSLLLQSQLAHRALFSYCPPSTQALTLFPLPEL